MKISKLFVWFTATRKRKILSSILAILIVLTSIRFAFFNSKEVEAAWFDDTYIYRKAITFTENTTADSNKKVKFDIDTAALTTDKMQADCDDTRFTDANGKLLRFYLDSAGGVCDTASTDYYVLMPDIVVGSNLIYMYYGNPAASSGSELSQFSEATYTPDSGPTLGSEEQSPGPANYFKFDEGNGSTTYDSGLNKKDGTINDSPAWKTEDLCVSGKCLYFNGNYVNAGAKQGPQSATTVEAWIRPTDTSGADAFVSQYGSSDAYFQFFTNGTDIYFRIQQTRDSVYIGRVATSVLEANNWQHYVGVWDGGTTASAIKIYKNGVRVDDTNNSAGSFTAPYSGSDVPLLIGAQNLGGNPYTGAIDEVKVFNYARTAAQIKADYIARGSSKGVSAQFGPDTNKSLSSGLVGYWKMDEASWTNDCTATSVTDSSGNANPGKSCPNAAGPTFPSNGKFGNVGSFEGTNDFLDMGDPALLDMGTSDWSASAWIKGTDGAAFIISKASATPYWGIKIITFSPC